MDMQSQLSIEAIHVVTTQVCLGHDALTCCALAENRFTQGILL